MGEDREWTGQLKDWNIGPSRREPDVRTIIRQKRF